MNFAIVIYSAGLHRISDASSTSIPWSVIDVKLRWKLRWLWIHLCRQIQLLIGALFPNVAVNLANFPKKLLLSLRQWACPDRYLK
jgi:hypothetical protein